MQFRKRPEPEHADDRQSSERQPGPRATGGARGVRGPRSNADIGQEAARVRRRRAAASSGARSHDPEAAIAQAGFTDNAEQVPFRGELESQLGVDLGDVRAFRGANAAEANSQLGSEAYALGPNIAFATESPDKELVAHEVAHTLQHDGSGSDSAVESEADTVASSLASGESVDPATLQGNAGGKVRKKESIGDKWRKWVADNDLTHSDPGSLARTDTTTTMSDDSMAKTDVTEAETNSFDLGSFAHEQSKTTEVGDVDAADRAKVMRAKIRAAKTEIATTRFRAVGNQLVAKLSETTTKSQIRDLDKLEPALVATKKAALEKKLKAIESRRKALKADVERCNKLTRAYDDAIGLLKKGKRPDVKGLADRLNVLGVEYNKVATTKTTSSLKVSAFDGLERSVTKSTTVHDGEKQSEATSSSKTTAKFDGGLKVENERSEGHEERDETGRVTEGSKTSKTTSAKLVSEGGAVGAEAGHKIRKAVTDSHGKTAFHEVGGGGAYTVNIVPLPPTDGPQRFAVVCTLDLSVNLTLGEEREKKHHAKDDDKIGRSREKARAKSSLAANVSAGASFTHTRAMDQAAVGAYLDNLAKAANGKKPSKRKPEFSMLAKAFEAVKSADDAASGIAAAFGSGSSAAEMANGESIEFTMKAGASLSGSLGADNGGDGSKADKSVGIDASVGGSTFRTIKIGRVGVGEQKLVEVTVAFGETNEMAGALSASALGVTAKAGKKEWSSLEKSVTFRLDAGAEEYDELYGEIVSTMSESSLVRLRKSPKYKSHVVAYTAKHGSGDSTDLSAKGPVGLSTNRTSERGSEETFDADGRRSIKETGSTKHSMAASLGPIDIWKHSRKDSATFDATENSSMLDIMSETDESVPLGGEMPALDDLLAGGAKAVLEKALLDNSKKLKGYSLTGDDVAKLVGRARVKGSGQHAAPWFNAQHHMSARYSGRDDAAWTALRLRLISNKAAPGFDVDHIDIARQVERGRAIADFFAAADNPKALVEVVLREWPKLGGSGADIGVQREWISLVAVRAPYEKVFRRVADLEVELAPFLEDTENGAELGANVCSEVQLELAKVIKPVENCNSFDEPRAKVEMVDELHALRKTIVQKRRAFFRSFSGEEPTQEDLDRDIDADANMDVTRYERVLRHSKKQEERLLDRGEKAEKNSHKTIAVFQGLKWDDEIEEILGKLESLYEAHKAVTYKLREAYPKAGIGRDTWFVGAGPYDKAEMFDIDFHGFRSLFRKFCALSPYRNYEDMAARHKRDYFHY